MAKVYWKWNVGRGGGGEGRAWCHECTKERMKWRKAWYEKKEIIQLHKHLSLSLALPTCPHFTVCAAQVEMGSFGAVYDW